ncbi:MAG: group 1 glycosyl transferase [Sphingomonas bacterium]|nr:group 1 glycosyl transferase [Sphingomonas bacterium]
MMKDLRLGNSVRRVAMIGNFPPRLCGIATFTADVRAALLAGFPDMAVDVYAMDEPAFGYVYPPDVVCTISQDELFDYRQAARRINDSGADVVLVQHEYGIFGGPAGAMLLRLLDRVTAPIVVTLHTVLETPDSEQHAVIEALAATASRLIVMADKGRQILGRVHGIPPEQIAVVPHGVPDRPRIAADTIKPRFGFEGRKILLTFGLLSPNKGIETMIRAMPAIAAADPDVLYVVLGATHPHLVAHEGEAYRERLIALAAELGVGGNVRFVDGFLAQDLLLEYLSACDIYVTPYLNEAQITSGTLSYAVGLGRPVVSTPYWHAAELLADGVGALVPFGSSDGLAGAIIALLADPERLEGMSQRAWQIGRGMTWARAADSYVAIFREAVARQPVRLIAPGKIADAIVPPSLEGIERMTDRTGMLQHSIYGIPDRDHGYCVDDNARALILMHMLDEPLARRADELARVYASFVQHAWNGKEGRFRNFMGFDRNWLEQAGSEDSFGRSLWSIGVTTARARRTDLRQWGLHLFNQVAAHTQALRSPRAWAFGMLGAAAVLEVHPGHALATSLLTELAARLRGLLAATRRPDWIWFEAVLGYDNARLPEALIVAGKRLGDADALADGLATLDWLDRVQTNQNGDFRAVGTDSFGRPFSQPAPYDQQPLEAWATLDAALTALEATGDPRWVEVGRRAYGWYLGANDLGLPIASIADGDCYDGLMADRPNFNRGAESVLSFQLACCSMQRLAKRATHCIAGNPVDVLAS